MTEALVESHLAEAVNAGVIAHEAEQKAQAALVEQAIEKSRQQFVQSMHELLQAGEEDSIFLRLGRVKFLCTSVTDINKDIAEINKKLDAINGIIWNCILGALTLLAIILMGLGSWAFVILVHVASH